MVEEGGGQTLLRMSGWRGMSVELVAELDTAAGRLLLYLDWWAQLTATRLRLVTVGHCACVKDERRIGG